MANSLKNWKKFAIPALVMGGVMMPVEAKANTYETRVAECVASSKTPEVAELCEGEVEVMMDYEAKQAVAVIPAGLEVQPKAQAAASVESTQGEATTVNKGKNRSKPSSGLRLR